MSWITSLEILVVWSLVGLGVAYLFGRFVQRTESAANGEAASAVVTYLDRAKRGRPSPRATTEARRAAGGRRR